MLVGCGEMVCGAVRWFGLVQVFLLSVQIKIMIITVYHAIP